ncbi:hypothetical protein LXA43DRAFT_1088607 [Ganoderma leucocontextum]|nr:hypothetical protein LXA43DRAFT_1088607 [Ganoderma leucocontextum]
MYSASSINLPVPDYRTMSIQHPDNLNCRSKLKKFIRRFGQHSTEHRDSRAANSSVSLAKSFSSYAAETADNDDMAWSRPSSRATTSRPSPRVKRHRLRATSPQGQAEMLDDENSAWARPSTDDDRHARWRPSHA